MRTDPTHCEQKVSCRDAVGFEQCDRPWHQEVEIDDTGTGGRRTRRFCGEHAQEARRYRGHGVSLVRRPEPLFTYHFRLELRASIGPARSEEEAQRTLARLLRPVAEGARSSDGDPALLALACEPELRNGPLLLAWEKGVCETEY